MRFISLGHGLEMHGNKACSVVNRMLLKSITVSLECGWMEEERSRSQDEIGRMGLV